MPQYHQAAVAALLAVFKSDPALGLTIRQVVQDLKTRPTAGKLHRDDLWLYSDPANRFVIGYHYNRARRDVTIVTINLH